MQRRITFGSIATVAISVLAGFFLAAALSRSSESRSNIPSDRPAITDFNQRR
jgi:hypothetical protein